MAPLYQKYEPAEWGDVVGQDEAIATLMDIKRRDTLAGRAYWIAGLSGTGKSTIAKLIAKEVASEWFIEEIDACGWTPAAVQELERSMHVSAWGKGGKAYIVNEAHGIRRHTMRQLMVTLDRLPPTVAFIFTTTKSGEEIFLEDSDDASPLISRCMRITLRSDVERDFARHVRRIASKEKLGGAPAAAYSALIRHLRCNMRAALQFVESGGMKRLKKNRAGKFLFD
jgi:DNA polymerase III gamma/tau subunit